MLRKLFVTAVWLAALVLNPFYACEDGAEGFQFTEADVRGAIEGTWKLEIAGHAPITLAIREVHGAVQARAGTGWVASAAACGSRSFVRPAHACMDFTMMELDVRVLAGARGSTYGRVDVAGTHFHGAELHVSIYSPRSRSGALRGPAEPDLSIGDTRVVAFVTPDGKATQVSINDAEPSATRATLVRSDRR
jgi:hypothetical protein